MTETDDIIARRRAFDELKTFSASSATNPVMWEIPLLRSELHRGISMPQSIAFLPHDTAQSKTGPAILSTRERPLMIT